MHYQKSKNFEGNWKILVDTGITGLETGLVSRYEFVSEEIVKHSVNNKSLKYFTTELKK